MMEKMLQNPSETPRMRADLQRSVEKGRINPLALSVLQRILLTTDGTVTEILEAYAGESMRVVKLYQEKEAWGQALPALELEKGAEVLSRKILLQGKISRTNFLYAESILVPDRLSAPVREGLLNSNKPIGQLMLERRVETFKEIIDCGKERAGALAPHFHLEEGSFLISRTYRVFTNGRPMMLITEKFPESYYLTWDSGLVSSLTEESREKSSGKRGGEA